MSVKKEASGRRSIQVEVECPGTPEEVWQAISPDRWCNAIGKPRG